MTALTLHEFDCVVSEAHGAHATPCRHVCSPGWKASASTKTVIVPPGCGRRASMAAGPCRCATTPAWSGPLRLPDRGAAQDRQAHLGGRSEGAADRHAEVPGRLPPPADGAGRSVHRAHAAAGRIHPLLPASVQSVVKRGVRNDYVTHRTTGGPARQAADGAAPDAEPGPPRPLLHRARRVLAQSPGEPPAARRPARRHRHFARPENQRLARELCFVFADVPPSSSIAGDLRAIRLDRGMAHYEAALDWARLILQGFGPVTSAGAQQAPSLLFPMEQLFEAYVRKHLASQLRDGHVLTARPAPSCFPPAGAMVPPEAGPADPRRPQYPRGAGHQMEAAGREPEHGARQVPAQPGRFLPALCLRPPLRTARATWPDLSAHGRLRPCTAVFDFPRTPGMRCGCCRSA